MIKHILIVSLLIGKLAFSQTEEIAYKPVFYFESSFSFGITAETFNTINVGGVLGGPISEHFWIGVGAGYNHIVDKVYEGGIIPAFVELSNYKNKKNPEAFQSLRLGIMSPGKGISPYLGFRTGKRKYIDEYLSCAFFMGMDITKMTTILVNPFINNGKPRTADIFIINLLAGVNLSF